MSLSERWVLFLRLGAPTQPFSSDDLVIFLIGCSFSFESALIGDAVEMMDDELPVFRACGVTPQYVAELSRIPFCISHSPGKMFVTDLKTE